MRGAVHYGRMRPALAGVARLAAAATGAGVAAALLAPVPAAAHNASHGDRVVSADPANVTPHVMNGSVNAIVQVGRKVVAAGTFTSVSPSSTVANIADDVVRNRIFAFDAVTGVIDPTFNPNLGGAASSLSTDGTHVYVGGSFGSVGGNTAIKRVVKLTTAGEVVTSFKAVPNAAVSEVVAHGGRLYVGGAFTSIKRGTVTTPRGALAAVRTSDGVVDPLVDVPFTGLYNGGSTTIKRFDLSPDGTKLAAVGNFTHVGGATHQQLAVVDTPAGAPAAVAPWSTSRFDKTANPYCANVFDSFMRDVDFAPDGTYFVVSTTGAFGGGASIGTLCDTITRWETASAGNNPTWTNYTGGDTTYGVAITDAAVYVGGHMRWLNNPFQGDQAGPGAVSRNGIAALDPVNGLPLSWNPGRTRGVGAQALHAVAATPETPAGLWVGSDTTRIGGEEHRRIAFFPLASGKQVPSVPAATLPNDLFLAESATCSSGGVLYRVNAGGPALPETNGSPSWTTDDAYRNTGSAATYDGSVAVDSTVPACTNPAIFDTERWDSGSAPELHYGFSVPAGTSVKVRMYFADRCGCTANAGSRVFDVAVDGVLRLDDFDINAQVGHNRGTMREVTVTSDGVVDIDLTHGIENPLINGIEIVHASGNGPVPAAGSLLRRGVDAEGAPTGPAATADASMNWSLARGAFYVNGTVYYGLPDGGLYARTFAAETNTLGPQRVVKLYDDPEDGTRIPFPIANVTGMAYDTGTHRLYYTVAGDDRLFFRGFTPESEVVGASTHVADAGGVAFGTARGLTIAGGELFYGNDVDSALRAVVLGPQGVGSAPRVVSNDGTWRSRAMFVPND